MKKSRIEYVVDVGLAHGRTARKCAVCGDPASRQVMRARKGHPPVLATLRFSCARHATLEHLYPVVVRAKLDPLPKRRGYQTPRGDQSMFYRDVMREMGGVVPMPDRETKEEAEDVRACLKRRKKNWMPPEPRELKFCRVGYRSHRPAGISGRQWVKLRKSLGLARNAR